MHKLMERIKLSNTFPLSFAKILYALEPFLIYGDNIPKSVYKDIEKLVNLKIPSKIKHGYEPDPNAVPEPPKQQNRNNFRGNKGRSNQNKKRNNYRK